MKILCCFLTFSLFSHVASSSPVVISGGTPNDIIGRVCRMQNGNLLAVIERNPDWISGDLYTSVSTDDGTAWSSLYPAVTGTGNQSTFSLLKGEGDSLLLFYASNESGTYRIYSAFSADGSSWTKTGEIPLPWASSQNVYDPVVLREPDGSLTMTYIALGLGAYVTHRSPAGAWDTIKTQVAASAYRARICRDLSGIYLAAYHRKTGTDYQYDVFIRTSADRLNWSQEIQLTTNLNSHDPFCAVTPDEAFTVEYAKNVSGIYNIHSRRSYDGINWETEQQITMDATHNTQPSFFFENGFIYRTWTHAVNYDTDNDIYFEKTLYEPNQVSEDFTGNVLVSGFSFSYRLCRENDLLLLDFESSSTTEISFILFDITGRKASEALEFSVSGKRTEYMDMSGLTSGVYFGHLRAGERLFFGKIMLLR
ncbi:exo-alpha-sialidase [candidate division WOR-3 bacterium]|nr:exo-alpha-sialidase [candidate division WOR-3 bacterium]